MGRDLARTGTYKDVREISQQMRILVDTARRNGYSDDEIMQELPDLYGAGSGGSSCQPTGLHLQSALQQQDVPWSPVVGACPQFLDIFLAWLMAGSCSYNKFGMVGSTSLNTNILTLPDPQFQFDVGPAAAALGVFFPEEWSAEAAYSGIHRVKIAIQVRVLQGGLDPNDLANDLFNTFAFNIIQRGTNTPFVVAFDFGEASDARDSVFVPSAGGYFMAADAPFVPWAFKPELQGFSFEGEAPGIVGTDVYAVQVRLRAYFKRLWQKIPGLPALPRQR